MSLLGSRRWSAHFLVALGCAAAIVSSAALASADLDPHQPDLTKNHCPGGQWGVGRLRVCDGEKYPDGSYWHQWEGGNRLVGPTWNYDCVGDSGNPVFPAPPPPGGCDGAIPLEPPPDEAAPPGEPAPPTPPVPAPPGQPAG